MDSAVPSNARARRAGDGAAVMRNTTQVSPAALMSAPTGPLALAGPLDHAARRRDRTARHRDDLPTQPATARPRTRVEEPDRPSTRSRPTPEPTHHNPINTTENAERRIQAEAGRPS